MGGVAEGIEEGHHILRQAFINDNHIGLGDAHILGKGTVPVHAYAQGVLAPLNVAVVAVAAPVAGDVSLSGDPLSHGKTGDAGTQGGYLAHILMAYGHGGLDMCLGPGVPIINVHIRATDGGLVYLDKHLAGAGNRYRHLPKRKSRAGGGLDDCIHQLFHNLLSNLSSYRLMEAAIR